MMENEVEKCCPKTKSRLDAIVKNLISNDNISNVDFIISKQVRKSLQKKAKELNVKLQFLYASDVDGWYDDVNNTIYLSLDHALKTPIQMCFNRETDKIVLATNKEIKRINNKTKSVVCVLVVSIVSIAFIAVLANVIDDYISVSSCIITAVSILFIALYFVEIRYDNSNLLPLKMKSKEETSSPVLGTINGIGGTLIFIRTDINTGWGVYYNYFVFLGIPIFFLGAYLAKEVDTHTWRRKSYKVLGQIATPWRDVYHFYMIYYGSFFIVGLLASGIYKLGSVLGWW